MVVEPTTKQLAAPAPGAQFGTFTPALSGTGPSLHRVNGASRTQKRFWPQQSLILGPTFSTGRAGSSPAPGQLLLPGPSAAELCRWPSKMASERPVPHTKIPALCPLPDVQSQNYSPRDFLFLLNTTLDNSHCFWLPLVHSVGNSLGME